ncbi:hypothetical protein SLNWT_6379 [Streptomyces albus]|uniref:Uncharacterized protein n=1 Tax=Streptomyces albus (strain ATCC 21838 / DSM 41398 / FERM P-419 / JCM 4703 / NBRC 107858) TaxID=1081613 RepID=A0A0B5F5B4_STRA4|nr:hypothetical protein SLNWT_6379 [Streptomyces albus]AOU81059.1 hypothetical protein SLNHY_6368 [Streptomyces albus]AYN36762.1 hypothetical protein DUI70_6267 [Streptomyces albus]
MTAATTLDSGPGPPRPDSGPGPLGSGLPRVSRTYDAYVSHGRAPLARVRPRTSPGLYGA